MTSEPVCPCHPDEVETVGWWRVGIGFLIAANTMTLSLAVSSSDVSPIDWQRIQLVLLGLAAASMALLGWPLARNVARAIRQRRVTIEAVFLTGVMGALVGSVHSMSTGVGESYFEIVTILLVVYALGQQLTRQVQDRAVRAAIDWAPEMNRCLILGADGTVERIPIDDLRPGHRVIIPPGAAITVDGVVESGEAFVREAVMTGEPFVVAKKPGDPVWAGTHCVDSKLTVRATTDGRGRRIDRILDAVDRARATPSSLQAQADRLVTWFLPTVLAIAGLTFWYWTVVDGWMPALLNAMAVLLVACPCALGLATPLVQWVAIARLARRGLAVQNADVIEALAGVETVVFDKTGTLTEPHVRLLDIAVDPPSGMTRHDVLSIVEAVETVAHHPVAEAFVGVSGAASNSWNVESMAVLPAAGLRSEVQDRSGRRAVVTIGAAERLGVAGSDAWTILRARLGGSNGAREIVAVVDGKIALAALVDERLRTSWREALGALDRQHRPTLVLTGDSMARARLTGAREVASSLGPEDKLERVEKMTQDGSSVLYVGDGVNDAAAMAAADVSIAVAQGADLATEVADAVWYGEDLRTIPWALEVGESSVRTIRGNLGLAASYNAVGIAVASVGLLHPVAAALLMTCSSLLVTWRSLRGIDADEPDRRPSTRNPQPDNRLMAIARG